MSRAHGRVYLQGVKYSIQLLSIKEEHHDEVEFDERDERHGQAAPGFVTTEGVGIITNLTDEQLDVFYFDTIKLEDSPKFAKINEEIVLCVSNKEENSVENVDIFAEEILRGCSLRRKGKHYYELPLDQVSFSD